MNYAIKEVYFTLQGEGAHAGRPAVFLRFTGCNLWTGREEDRQNAVCQFCDTNFIGTDGPRGGVYATAREIAEVVDGCWPKNDVGGWVGNKLVVCTGGEPLLQLDTAIIDALHDLDFTVAIETNGTKLPPDGVDWVCVSPKANAPLVLTRGNELKLIFPQVGADPSRFKSLEFDRFFLQPMDGPSQSENTQLAAQYCLEHPQWELSLQTHKLIGLP